MQVIITSAEDTESGKYFLIDCGKTSAHIYVSKAGYINVCCKNASHKAWKGSGRYFLTSQDAVEAYKSPEMKAIISAALEA